MLLPAPGNDNGNCHNLSRRSAAKTEGHEEPAYRQAGGERVCYGHGYGDGDGDGFYHGKHGKHGNGYGNGERRN